MAQRHRRESAAPEAPALPGPTRRGAFRPANLSARSVRSRDRRRNRRGRRHCSAGADPGYLQARQGKPRAWLSTISDASRWLTTRSGLRSTTHLFSLEKRHKFVLKTSVSPDEPQCHLWSRSGRLPTGSNERVTTCSASYSKATPTWRTAPLRRLRGVPGRKSFPFHDYTEW